VFTRATLVFVLTLVPLAADAQSVWDVSASTGLFSGHTPRTTGRGYQDSWFQSVQGGLSIGRYITPHFKLEFDAAATNGGRQIRERLIDVPGYPYPYPIGSEVTTSVRSLGAAMVWQFADNAWVHPFLQAGVSTDFDRVTVRTWEQRVYGDPRAGTPSLRVSEDRIEGPATTRAVRALLGGGAKFYVTENAFVRTDARWTFDRARHNLAFRIGFGIDMNRRP
jgi:hypothetical protein